MPHSDKKPKTNYKAKKKSVPTHNQVTTHKEATHEIDSRAFFSQHPVWSFQFVDKEHFKWGVSCNESNLCELLAKMESWEKSKWSEIINDDKKNHYIPICELSREAKSRALMIKLEEKVDSLFSLRLNAKYRVFGILESSVFKVVWIDPNHEVCISNLKHT